MPSIIPIPALEDNYIWAIVNSKNKAAAIVDPGEASPVLSFLAKEKLTLAAILITHRHWDHTNGIGDLLASHSKKIPVYGPAHDPVSLCTQPLEDNDQIYLKSLDIEFTILHIPGHTKGHIAYIGLGSAFTGDTLFTGGCGRVFEGTPDEMTDSLSKLTDLPPETLIYCGHEYTTKNLQFAELVEPNNSALQKRIQDTALLRKKNKSTVPSTLQLELDTNPFLRTHIPEVQKSASKHTGKNLNDPISVFAALRNWKDHF